MPGLAVFPGSFNPPTKAHLALAEHTRRRHRLDRLDLVVSRQALAKEPVQFPKFDDRIEVLEKSVAALEWLSVIVTEAQLLVDIARGYDLLILGADKWWQIRRLEWYESEQHRDRALAAMPETVVFPRDGYAAPPGVTLELEGSGYGSISSSRARNGELHLMTPSAREFAERTGAWINEDRYRDWRAALK